MWDDNPIGRDMALKTPQVRVRIPLVLPEKRYLNAGAQPLNKAGAYIEGW